MSFVRISRRIVVQPLLSKADVEAIYRDVLGPLGGDSYTNGVLSGPFNGSLDHRNFARHAGFTNTAKGTKTSIYPVQIRVAAPTGTSSYRVSMPFIGDGVSPALTPATVRWTLAFGNSGPSSGTAKLFTTQPGAAEYQLGAAGGQTWAAANPLTIIANEVIASVPLVPQTSFRLELAITSGTAKDFVALIWMRSLHVR